MFWNHPDWLNRHSELIIARCRGLAAAKLVELTGCEKEETARKACMDIIMARPCSIENAGAGGKEDEGEIEDEQISPEETSVILAALAEVRAKKKNEKAGRS